MVSLATLVQAAHRELAQCSQDALHAEDELGEAFTLHVDAMAAVAEAQASDNVLVSAEGQTAALMQHSASMKKASGSRLEKFALEPSVLKRICECKHGRKGSVVTQRVLSQWWATNGAVVLRYVCHVLPALP